VQIADAPAVELQLFGKTAPDGNTWQISDGSVVVTLEKANEGETWVRDSL
jgi:hypothetical protein